MMYIILYRQYNIDNIEKILNGFFVLSDSKIKWHGILLCHFIRIIYNLWNGN